MLMLYPVGRPLPSSSQGASRGLQSCNKALWAASHPGTVLVSITVGRKYRHRSSALLELVFLQKDKDNKQNK